MQPADPSRFHLRTPPLLLYSYIANEMLAPFFASFLILSCVFFLVRLIPLLEIVLTLRIDAADLLRLFAYIFPQMMVYIITMAGMAGVIIGFTRLTNDREILALKSCGISLSRMLPPVACVAGGIAWLAYILAIHLAPMGELGFKQLMLQLVTEQVEKGLKEREFTDALGNIVVYVDDIDEHQYWRGVYVSDMRGRDQPLITVARAGHMQSNIEKMTVTIVLNNGSMHNNDGTDSQTIRFKRYLLNIPLQPPTQVGKDNLTEQSRGMMSQEQLLAAAARHPPHSREAQIYLSEYHGRLILPVGCFILALLGVPLGLQAGPGRQAAGVPLGLAFFVLYYITLTTCEVMTEEGHLPLVPGLWLPNLLFAVLTLVIFRRVNREQPLIPEKMQEWGEVLHERYTKPLFRRIMALVRFLARLPRKDQ
jgi:lipopolysaccharide export system permease protein